MVDRVLGIAGLLPPPPGATFVDVGCGTGISTRAFAAAGLRAIGVDPNASMLAEARAAGGGPEYREGEAAATGLPDRCADLVVAAQAFHWFEPGLVLAEFRRLLRPGGWAAVFWNVRRLETPFSRGYAEALHRFCPGWREVRKDEAALEELRARTEVADRVDLAFDHDDLLGREALLGRVRSASYVAHECTDRPGLEREIARLFEAHASGGSVPWTLRVVGSCFRLP
jgi:SAM-dependent methyltransferase